MRYRLIIVCAMLLLVVLTAKGQISIGGNVYGGGNKGEVKGNTRVTVRSGNIGARPLESLDEPAENAAGRVFGGARMANVGGNAYVNIDGEHATDYIVINNVFGGNDISGVIGSNPEALRTLPAELVGNPDGVDETWDAYVHLSTKKKDDGTGNLVPDDSQKTLIGKVFAGGNGDFEYTDEEGEPLTDGKGNYIVVQNGQTIAFSTSPFSAPVLNKSYLDIQGGSIGQAYGGGNNVTITEKAVIHVDNPSAVVTSVKVDANGIESDSGTDILTTARFKDMGINTMFSYPSSDEFQVGSLFGGNNKAEMTIRPQWDLMAGTVRNLYSGGNRGSMTCSEGLLLEIPTISTIIVDNLYGGCRMADVKPTVNGIYTPVSNLDGYFFPKGLSARVLVRGGDVNNVYGGNDITGKVYGGNAVGIYKSVRGDVYGGGNGAYPYTNLYEGDELYGDLYYDGNTTKDLNDFRPNAEQVSIRLAGTAVEPTIIGGSVFVGGNCATLKTIEEEESTPMVELKIGSHVIADKVFLGNNGAKMVDPTILKTMKTINSLALTDPSVFAEYMDGAAMGLKPDVVFDSKLNGDPDNYEDYTSQIGSFFLGGNVGSITVGDKGIFRLNKKLIIYEKLVGGCNSAYVPEVEGLHAAYDGGVIGTAEEQANYWDGENMKDRLEINLDDVVIQPKRWNDTFTQVTVKKLVKGKVYYMDDSGSGEFAASGEEVVTPSTYYEKIGDEYVAVSPNTLYAGETYYTTMLRGSSFVADGTEVFTGEGSETYYELTSPGTELVWNTVKWDLGEDDFIPIGTSDTSDDDDRRLYGGNVYGGCFNSGHMNGNVIININQDLHQRDVLFAEADPEDPYTIAGDRRTGVLLESQGDDVMAVAMAVFGAGCGEATEVWGNTTVNLNNGYVFEVFGGGEEGVVGKKNASGDYEYNKAYSTNVYLKGLNAGYSPDATERPALAETEYIYGAGNEGDVCGDSYVYLGNGRVYDAFGGASNAHIYGGTEVYVGHNGGFPWIRDNVYGGNDFGGIIKGYRNHINVTSRPFFDTDMLLSSTYVKYLQGRVDTIFGGSYGSYDYTDRIFKDYTDADGTPLKDDEGNPIFVFPHLEYDSFVHFEPVDNANNHVDFVFGGSEGFAGNIDLNNAMQEEAYVLVDDTQTKDPNRFSNVDIYGGGAFAGLGTSTALGAGRSAIDLFAGSFRNIYGGCNKEGLIGYTRVNVPESSTVKVQSIFGGGQGYSTEEMVANNELYARYCDHYVTCVDYRSKNAIVEDAIYGGNRNSRIACDTYINISAPVLQSSGYQATIYGAGFGDETVSGRTNIFMNNGSNAYKVFGGGRDGYAFNFASLQRWLGEQFSLSGVAPGDVTDKVTAYGDILRSFGTYIKDNPIELPEEIGTYVNADGEYDGTYTNDIMPTLAKPMPDYHQTNVHIMNGGNVSGYAYGGGYGADAIVSGTTYLELLGGNVDKDIYGGGQGGHVYDEFGLGLGTFTATTNVYIEGGMARNVYGGGYQGHVGKHTGDISNAYASDIPAVANVVIGKVDGNSFYNGIPAIMRNAYGGGEGGSVYGTTNLTINNGYIGYRYKDISEEGAKAANWQYVEELDDKTPNAIERAGNAFGGGYVVDSYVDEANVTMYGGIIRGSLYGGGEVGPIGAGTTKPSYSPETGILNGDVRIFRAGKTLVKMYDGLVKRNVFGGGRGHDSWGGDGTMYMDDDVVESLKTNGMFCKGYVFGQTEVNIYGGEVGTDEGVSLGHGNVFGGGDLGFVYSAYELENGTLCIGKKEGTRYTTTDEGYYYKAKKNGDGYDFLDDDGNVLLGGAEKHLTEDCKVLVEPWCKANSSITIDGTSYAAGDYVPTAKLNHLGGKNADSSWTILGKDDVNKEGVIIHNAVFAGGNTSAGSTEVYANTTTVFGNATASIHDVYHRDLITIGKGRVGGLYGDGNLTLVDGYRELNITNYGTDYYHITTEITKEQYDALPKREAAYYEIRYRCLTTCTDDNGKTYAQGSTITADEMQAVFVTKEYPVPGTGTAKMLDSDGKPLSYYWVENGVCSRYAGRPMNTVQRADFCGVFGSRMIMQGAQDRVPETVDYTNYTINRVREVSLNKKISLRADDAGEARNAAHGNYFGIYSVVNFLGALTSDLDFQTATRVTDNSDVTTYQCKAGESGPAYGVATYYDWKEAFHNDRKRNNGNSHNKVALASGVYLELTHETSRGNDLYEKDWGLITGVVELDLINVQPGMGGGYVYAKNAHGIRSSSGKTQTLLTELNTGAVTNKQFQYDETEGTKKEWETSGNFVHSTQTIIDDCYDQGGKYLSGYNKPNGVPAHYWFIKGAIHIYDQYISAYTGSPNAYSEVVHIPLTITSASHGRLTLLNVQPNRYAYYSVNNGGTTIPLGENGEVELRDVKYGVNDAINYWDYSTLAQNEKNLFVEDTYVVTADCTYGDGATAVTYKAGTVLLPSEYKSLKTLAPKKDFDDKDGLDILTPYVHHVGKNQDVDFDYVFRPSNNVSHDNGYILTYNVNNPEQWSTWYTPKSGSAADRNQTGGTGYEDGPTYTPKTAGLYGQNDYTIGSIIDKEVYDTYQDVVTNHSSSIPLGQAKFYPAYIVTDDLLETTNKDGNDQRLHKGVTLAEQNYEPAIWTSISSSVAPAYVVTSTIQLSKTDYIYRNTYMTKVEKDELIAAYPTLAADINKYVVPAYYCTEAGKYGGNYYETGKNYRALAAFCSMSESDRANFEFNYDAFDLLIDPTYSRAEGVKYQYDVAPTTGKDVLSLEVGDVPAKAQYSLETPIDYTATYKGGGSLSLASAITVKHNGGASESVTTVVEGDTLSRVDFEALPNERQHYSAITAEAGKTYYVVKQTVVMGDTPYAAGQVITSETYADLSDSDKTKVTKLTFTTGGNYFYCHEGYTINTSDYADENKGKVTTATGVTVTDGLTSFTGGTEYSTAVPVGIVISEADYVNVINKQANFVIHGLAPTETSTLYVTREADIFDLSAEKIITVIYRYDYLESDMDGMHITPVTEYHVLNIHLNFKSGVPTVEDISAPDLVLPGTSISIPEPYVTPGAYEITGGGWKLFDTETDAESHINGMEYTPIVDPLFLYQNGYYLAYYAKTYLGETYSNHVPVSVANYHDLKKVMDDTEHHYYIDHKDVHEKQQVEPKIYINDYSGSSENGLDLFKNLYDLTLVRESGDGYTVTDGKITGTTGTANSALENHALLNSRVNNGEKLEFFLRTDLSRGDDPAIEGEWTPIASGTGQCFAGTLHGDGHTISGLDNSLFGHLCGHVYNLGVTGSFKSAGVADEGDGYVESCWINTTSESVNDVRAVFGNPTATSDTKQLVNSYYQTGKSYSTTDDDSHGLATAKPDRAFFNGEVAYDLNNFYLFKRYNDHNAPGGSSLEYSYFEDDGTGTLVKKTGKYADNIDNVVYCSSGYNGHQYVEDRFRDGDFRYAAGTIPDYEEERQYVDPDDETKISFYPIWPDDYLFFGQKLTYGYSATQAHQDVPTAINRFEGRLSYNPDANRVYRAPAYYGSKVMGAAHFNPQVYLAQKTKDGTREAYPGMTAIDFAGHNDMHDEGTKAVKPYQLGLNDGKFYAPLLDDGGLQSIVNQDETQNLLVYAPAPSGDGYVNAATHTVLTGYFEDPSYDDYYSDDDYRKVADATPATSSIYGHLVQTQGDPIATNDHLLVDKQDFNCPIAYTFDGDHRMWYQRIPNDEEFVDHTKGWMSISIPFTAELVTTNDKGEISHFYSGSAESWNGTGSLIGHEYWLREFNNIELVEGSAPERAKATFLYPSSAVGDEKKTVTNTFLWDYYYKNTVVHNQKDRNRDDYQTYYERERDYAAYPLLHKGKPYLIGLPGNTYYEFDLSGNFEAQNTFAMIDKLGIQTVTFASNTGIEIQVSDDEGVGVTKSREGGSKDYTFTFHRNYATKDLSTTDFVMKSDGSQFDLVTAEGGSAVSGGATAIPFRPYFSATAVSKARRAMPEYIFFGGDYNGLDEEPQSDLTGELKIYAKGHKIITTSYLNETTTVRIVDLNGITIAEYALEPGETVETPIRHTGVYIVNQKKILVK